MEWIIFSRKKLVEIRNKNIYVQGCFENVQGKTLKSRKREKRRKEEKKWPQVQNLIYFCYTHRLGIEATPRGLKHHRWSQSLAARQHHAHHSKNARAPMHVYVRFTCNQLFQIKHYFIYAKILNCPCSNSIITKKN